MEVAAAYKLYYLKMVGYFHYCMDGEAEHFFSVLVWFNFVLFA